MICVLHGTHVAHILAVIVATRRDVHISTWASPEKCTCMPRVCLLCSYCSTHQVACHGRTLALIPTCDCIPLGSISASAVVTTKCVPHLCGGALSFACHDGAMLASHAHGWKITANTITASSPPSPLMRTVERINYPSLHFLLLLLYLSLFFHHYDAFLITLPTQENF